MMDAEPTELQQLSRSELVAKIVDMQGQIDQAAELGQAMMGQLEGLGHAKDEAARLSAEAEDMRAELEESSWRLTELGEQNTTLQRLLIGAEERAEAAAASAAAAAAGSTVSERDSHASLSLVVDDGVNKSDAEDRAEHTTKAKLQSDAALLKAQATVAHLTTELTKAKAAEVDLIKAKDAEYTARIVADKEAKSLARQLAKSEEKVVEYAGALKEVAAKEHAASVTNSRLEANLCDLLASRDSVADAGLDGLGADIRASAQNTANSSGLESETSRVDLEPQLATLEADLEIGRLETVLAAQQSQLDEDATTKARLAARIVELESLLAESNDCNHVHDDIDDNVDSNMDRYRWWHSFRLCASTADNTPPPLQTS